jgi:hypothetical protein
MQEVPKNNTNPNLGLCPYFALNSIPMLFSGMSNFIPSRK